MSSLETTPKRKRGTGRPPGRPTKLTSALTEAICVKIRAGTPPEPAAVSLGVAASTFRSWLTQGRAEGASQRHREFILCFEQAQADFHEIMVNRAASDPRNAIPILERRFPKDWARQDHHKIDVSVTTRPLIDPSKGSLERLQLLRELLAEFSPDAIDVPRDGAPAIELLAGIVEGELVSEEEVA